MTANRRSGYALIYMLAALPLALAVLAVVSQVIDRTFRGQRLAVSQTQNDDAARRLVSQLKQDAGDATAARLDDANGQGLTLSMPDRSIVYRVVDGAVTQTRYDDGEPSAEMTWAFKDTTVTFDVETLTGGGAVVWVNFAFEYPGQRNLRKVQQLTAAAAIGGRGPSS